ncbi:hypothetical protein GOP47_0016044 [Adiantum capillus-veneris]|uniref:Uncharacterized protein n=1 Tax=Adiantum capillus-veneris TaxID=13818 RepID=A0A9D4ZBS3_ADICA|nr:hypothetical protein GOP47_0016044 [Adiantum capillus-veneris]
MDDGGGDDVKNDIARNKPNELSNRNESQVEGMSGDDQSRKPENEIKTSALCDEPDVLELSEPDNLHGQNEPDFDDGGLGNHSHHPKNATNPSAPEDGTLDRNLVGNSSLDNDNMDAENSTPDWTQPASDHPENETKAAADEEHLRDRNLGADLSRINDDVNAADGQQQLDDDGTSQKTRTELEAQEGEIYQPDCYVELNEHADEIVMLDMTEEDESLGASARTPVWWERGTDVEVRDVPTTETPNWFEPPGPPTKTFTPNWQGPVADEIVTLDITEEDEMLGALMGTPDWWEKGTDVEVRDVPTTETPDCFEPPRPSTKTPYLDHPPAGLFDEVLPLVADSDIVSLDFGEEDEGQQTPDWLKPPNFVVEERVQGPGTPNWFAPPEANIPPSVPPHSDGLNVQNDYCDTSPRVRFQQLIRENRRRSSEDHPKIQALMYPLPKQSLLLDLPLYNTYHHHHVHQMKSGTFDENSSKSTNMDPSHHIHTSRHKVVLVEVRLYTLHPTSLLPQYFKKNEVEIRVTSQEPATYSTVIAKQNSIEFIHHIVHTHDIHINHANYESHFTVPSIWTQTCTRTKTQCRCHNHVGEFLHNHFHEHIHSILIRPVSFLGEPDEIGKYCFLNVMRLNVLDGTKTQLG